MSVRDRLGSSSDLLKSWGGVWRSRVECVCRVVYLWCTVVIVRVTCGACSHIALRLQCAYVWREACL